MAKAKSRFVCRDCGAAYPKWQGQCHECGAWNTLEEEAAPVIPAGERVIYRLHVRGFTMAKNSGPISAFTRRILPEIL